MNDERSIGNRFGFFFHINIHTIGIHRILAQFIKRDHLDNDFENVNAVHVTAKLLILNERLSRIRNTHSKKKKPK